MNESIDPIRIISKVRNNRLMSLRESLGMCVKEFAAYVGLSYHAMNEIENLSRFPSEKSMELMRAKLGSIVDEMFPEYLRDVATLTVVRTVPEPDILQLTTGLNLMIEGPEENIVQSEMAQFIHAGLRYLRPKERQVIKLRYGFDDGREWSLSEVAGKMSISRERVRQIEYSALRRLRKPSISRTLIPWSTSA